MYKDYTIDSTQCHNDFALSFTPSPQRTAIPSEGEYSISRGVGTDSTGKKFLAGGQTRQPQQPLTYQQQWGADRGVNPGLLALNSSEWGGIEDAGTPEGQWAMGELIPWIESHGHKAIGDHGRSQYVTTAAQRLAAKYSSEGLFIEGINPETGEPSGDRQLRLQHPSKKGPKYLRPKGGTAKVFFAQPDQGTANRIAKRYKTDIPKAADLWKWAKDQRIPLVLVEGAGDAMGGLSNGFLSIGAPGHHMCFIPGTDTLKPELQWAAENGPKVYIAFDQDSKRKTIRAVNQSRVKVAKALSKLGCQVRIVTWSPEQGKGFGDLSPEDQEQAIANCQSFRTWYRTTQRAQGEAWVRDAILHPFDRPYDLTITTPEELIAALATHPHSLIDGQTGTGKTEAFKGNIDLIESNHYLFSPTRTLARNAASRLGLAYLNEAHYKGADDLVAGVINSIEKIRNPVYPTTGIYLDEVEQLLESLIDGETNREHRAAKIAKLGEMLTTADRVCAASATANQKDLDFLEAKTGKRYTLIHYAPNLHPKGKYTIHTGNDEPGSDTRAKNYVQSLAKQPKTHVFSDSIKETFNLEAELGQDKTPLVVNQFTTKDDPQVQQFIISPNPGQWWADNMMGKSLINSPSIQSGFSIKNPEGVQLFDQVVGLSCGQTVPPATFVQMGARYRDSVDRAVYAPRCSSPPSVLAMATGKNKRQAWDQNSQDYSKYISQGGTWSGFGFEFGPEADYLRELHLQRDLEYRHYAAAVAAYAERDGYQVAIDTPQDAPEGFSHKEAIQKRLAAPVAMAEPQHPETIKKLRSIPEPKPEQEYQIEAYDIRCYYGLSWDAPLTLDQVIDEGFGKGRAELARAQRLVWDGKAQTDDQVRRASLGDSGFVWDATCYEKRLELWEGLGIEAVLAHCLENPYSYRSPEIQKLAATLARLRQDLQRMPRLLGVQLPHYDRWSPDPHAWAKAIVKWIGQVFRSLGIKTLSTRKREGDLRYYLYQVDQSSLEGVQEQLQRTAKTQVEKGFTLRSTRLVSILYERIDLPGTPPLSEEVQGVQDTPEEVQVAPKPGTPPQDLAA